MKTKRILLFACSLLISSLITFLLTNKKGDAWEAYVRTALYKISADSIPDFDVDIIDSLGVPYTFYPTQNSIRPGNQYNATIVCNYALLYYDSLRQNKVDVTRKKFMYCVQWLQQNLQRRNGMAFFVFNWQQPWYDSVKTPFTSGMTSALAMQVFTRAYDVFRDSALLTDASLLLHGFNLPVDAGGFTYKEKHGWWFEELADTAAHTPRILDGHLFALLGLYDYYQRTPDSNALFYFKKGFASLKNALPAYDAGNGLIYYDRYGKLADNKYRHIITGQIQQLATITGDKQLLDYYLKWRKPPDRPYVYRAIGDYNRSGIILLVLVWLVVFMVGTITVHFLHNKFTR